MDLFLGENVISPLCHLLQCDFIKLSFFLIERLHKKKNTAKHCPALPSMSDSVMENSSEIPLPGLLALLRTRRTSPNTN